MMRMRVVFSPFRSEGLSVRRMTESVTLFGPYFVGEVPIGLLRRLGYFDVARNKNSSIFFIEIWF